MSGERKQETQVPQKKLKICFTHDLPDKVDYQNQVDDLQHQCILMWEHISVIEESLFFYKEQRADLDELYQEKDKCVSQLSQAMRNKKEELQELLLHLCTAFQNRIPAASRTPAAEDTSHLSGPMNMEVMEEQQSFEEVQLEDNPEPAQQKAGGPCPLENPTTEQIVLLLPEMQGHQELAVLGNESSFPFISGLMQVMSSR